MKKPDTTKLAVDAASKAIEKVIGPNLDRDLLCEIALMIAHSSVTANENLDLDLSRRNTEIFCAQLKALVERTQAGKNSGSECGRLM